MLSLAWKPSSYHQGWLVRMNITDVQQVWPPVPAPTTPTDHLAEFSGVLSGGQAGPASPAEAGQIRTGPSSTLIHIKDSERNIDDGSLVVVNETRSWNGVIWVARAINNPDCYDPGNLPTNFTCL